MALVDERAPDDARAQGLAQGELDRRVAGEVVLRGVALGDPRLRPGCAVELSGVDPAVAGVARADRDAPYRRARSRAT